MTLPRRARLARQALPMVSRAEAWLTDVGRVGVIDTNPDIAEQELTEFRPRTDDIYIVSFPKSGATLLQMMLYQLTTEGTMNFAHIHSVVPFIDESAPSEMPFIERLQSPRTFKTHWQRDVVTKYSGAAARYIYIVRHPGDIIVSAHNHFTLKLGRPIPLDEFVAQFNLTIPPWGSWGEHTGSWWPHRTDEDVLFLTYEEVTRALGPTTVRVAAFCGIECDGMRRRRVEERCSFDFMRAHEAQFDPRLRTIMHEASHFLRRGGSGHWVDELNEEGRLAVKTVLEATSRELGEHGIELARCFNID